MSHILEARLDLCRERGFVGALLAELGDSVPASGFAVTTGQRLMSQRR